MARIWGMRTPGRKAWHLFKPHTHVVYLYFLSYPGLSCYPLYGDGFLGEHEEVHIFGKAQPAEISLVIYSHCLTQPYKLLQ